MSECQQQCISHGSDEVVECYLIQWHEPSTTGSPSAVSIFCHFTPLCVPGWLAAGSHNIAQQGDENGGKGSNRIQYPGAEHAGVDRRIKGKSPEPSSQSVRSLGCSSDENPTGMPLHHGDRYWKEVWEEQTIFMFITAADWCMCYMYWHRLDILCFQ